MRRFRNAKLWRVSGLRSNILPFRELRILTECFFIPLFFKQTSARTFRRAEQPRMTEGLQKGVML